MNPFLCWIDNVKLAESGCRRIEGGGVASSPPASPAPLLPLLLHPAVAKLIFWETRMEKASTRSRDCWPEIGQTSPWCLAGLCLPVSPWSWHWPGTPLCPEAVQHRRWRPSSGQLRPPPSGGPAPGQPGRSSDGVTVRPWSVRPRPRSGMREGVWS